MSKLLPHQYKSLYKFKLPNLLNSEGKHLPESYKKFYREWMMSERLPVHYEPVKSNWTRNEATGEVKRVENVPIPLIFPPESNKGLWGGEGVIKGFQKRHERRAKVPHFWVPNLKKTAVYSEILDKTFKVTVTDRTIDLIIENKGFDNYLLNNKACDLQSTLACKLKQKLLHALFYQELYPNNPVRKQEVLNKYKHHLAQYTEEDINWYGLTFDEALDRKKKIDKELNKPKPLKHVYRQQLLAKLVEDINKKAESEELEVAKGESSWLSRLNPFSKKSS